MFFFTQLCTFDDKLHILHTHKLHDRVIMIFVLVALFSNMIHPGRFGKQHNDFIVAKNLSLFIEFIIIKVCILFS